MIKIQERPAAQTTASRSLSLDDVRTVAGIVDGSITILRSGDGGVLLRVTLGASQEPDSRYSFLMEVSVAGEDAAGLSDLLAGSDPATGNVTCHIGLRRGTRSDAGSRRWN